MKQARFEVYQRKDGKWEWRLRAGNHRIVATSHNQGYRSSYEARRAAVAAREVALDALSYETGTVRVVEVES